MCSRKSLHCITQPKWAVGVAKSVHRRGQSQAQRPGVKLRVCHARLLRAGHERGGGEGQNQKRIRLHGANILPVGLLFVENFEHVVGGFFVAHEAELLHDGLLDFRIFFGPGKLDQVVTISGEKERLDDGFSGLRV